ncbi:unnamed protein product [Rhizophagus irregularis]|nr:unnamed protein product [Rhizophagus irregularis]CAB5366706.1 unnamed protein product [Rhizophagus irregularis]
MFLIKDLRIKETWRYFDHSYENRAVLVVLFVQKMVRLSWSMLTRPDNPVFLSSYRSLSTKKNPLSAF